MNAAKPPRLAVWILQEFGPELNQEALAGDLNEAFQQGRSKAWYWRQVLAAIRWHRVIRPLLASAVMAWLTSWPTRDRSPIILSLPIDMAVITAAYFASTFAPGIKRGKFKVLLTLLLAVASGLLCFYKPYPIGYWSVLWWVACSLVLGRKARRRVRIRELVFGDRDAERQRLMEKLHLAMMQETDPKAHRAYAESIAALQRHESKGAKAT